VEALLDLNSCAGPWRPRLWRGQQSNHGYRDDLAPIASVITNTTQTFAPFVKRNHRRGRDLGRDLSDGRGRSACGSIDTNGVSHAPKTVPTVTRMELRDYPHRHDQGDGARGSTKTATATVTIVSGISNFDLAIQRYRRYWRVLQQFRLLLSTIRDATIPSRSISARWLPGRFPPRSRV